MGDVVLVASRYLVKSILVCKLISFKFFILKQPSIFAAHEQSFLAWDNIL